MKAGRWILVASVLLAVRLCEAKTETHLAAKLEPLPPFAPARAAAAAAGIPLDGIEPLAPGGALCPDDSVTALVTLHQKSRPLTQWIVYFQAATNAAKVPTNAAHPMVMYTSTGNKFEFNRSPATIRIRTLGPFTEPGSHHRPSPHDDESAEVSVNQAFLALGLDRGAGAASRWNHFEPEKDATNFMRSFTFSHAPFDSARIRHDKKLADGLRVTPEEERAVVGWVPALQCYFSTVQETPDLESMMRKVVSLPSVWSLVRHLGMKVGIGISYHSAAPFPAAGWGFPAGSSIYSVLAIVEMNDHDALDLTMIAAPPRPPLLTCGGIIGFLAQNPDDEDNYLTLRVISAHRAANVKH